jgi:signal transduction histidine kinase
MQLLPERLDDPEFLTTFVQLTNSELDRVSTLINDLLTFSRPAPVTHNAVQVNDLAEQVVRLLTGQAKEKRISLTTRLSPSLPPFTIDPDQIKQVFMNLVLNALQATSAGGTVVVTTSLLHDPDGRKYCEIAVQDTGEGIRAENKEEIFNPFFTTKDSGVGLGLFITHQIIREHRGTIDVESAVGRGSRFVVRLPLEVPLEQQPLLEAVSKAVDYETGSAVAPPQVASSAS